jgi:hypothetical protein
MMQFIEAYIEDLDQTFIIPEFEFEPGEEIEEFIQRQRPDVIRALAVALTLLVESGHEIIPCFAIKDTDLIFNVNREEAGYSVEQCIEYFQEVEDYEKCAKLLNLKTKL